MPITTGGGHVHTLDRVRGVRGALLPLTCPVLYFTCPFARLHASRIVWPACVSHCVAASDVARIGARASACARAVCSPTLGRGLGPVRRRRRRVLVGHPACLPRLPASLQFFPPVPPERGGAFCLSRRLIDFRSGSHVTPQSRLKLAPQPFPFSQRRNGNGGTIGRCPPHAHACQVWGLGCRHRRSCFQGSARTPFFFSGSSETLPSVVLQNNQQQPMEGPGGELEHRLRADREGRFFFRNRFARPIARSLALTGALDSSQSAAAAFSAASARPFRSVRFALGDRGTFSFTSR